MVVCSIDGQRCSSPVFRRSFHKTKWGQEEWIDSSVQCLTCGAGWIERLDEPLVSQ